MEIVLQSIFMLCLSSIIDFWLKKKSYNIQQNLQYFYKGNIDNNKNLWIKNYKIRIQN